MPSDRRQFLSVLAAGATAVVAAPSSAIQPTSRDSDDLGPHSTWEQVRALFELRPDRIHMSGLLFASHPRPVRDAIARHRDELQRDPAGLCPGLLTPGHDVERTLAAVRSLA